jgi:branched-chain amino acid transport system substrate-binding protein
MRPPAPIAAACCACVLALVSCASRMAAREAEPVLIGLYADLSSAGAREGNDALKGAELRIDDVNAKGGVINGRPARLIAQDMKQSATEAVKAFTALAQEQGACAVIGSTIANAGLAVSPVADLVKVPLVSLALDDRITNPELKPADIDTVGSVRQYVFLVQPSAMQMAALLATYATRGLFLARYATLYDPSSPLSILQARAFETVVKKAGKIISASVELPEGDPLTPLKRIQEADTDAVFICCSTEKNAAVALQARAMAYRPVLLGNQAWYAPLLGQAGEAAGSAWFGMPVSPDDPGLAEFGDRLLARYGETPRPSMVPGWDAVGFIVAAVRRAGSTDPHKVRDALEQMKAYKGLTGPVEMGRKTHKPSVPTMAVMRILQGAYATAEPRYTGK